MYSVTIFNVNMDSMDFRAEHPVIQNDRVSNSSDIIRQIFHRIELDDLVDYCNFRLVRRDLENDRYIVCIDMEAPEKRHGQEYEMGRLALERIRDIGTFPDQWFFS